MGLAEDMFGKGAFGLSSCVGGRCGSDTHHLSTNEY